MRRVVQHERKEGDLQVEAESRQRMTEGTNVFHREIEQLLFDTFFRFSAFPNYDLNPFIHPCAARRTCKMK
jgi:hypothetical protein